MSNVNLPLLNNQDVLLLFDVYLDDPPPSKEGFKRKWNDSDKFHPGYWSYIIFTKDMNKTYQGVDIEGEDMIWNYKYEVWLPRENDLREEIFSCGLKNIFFENEIIKWRQDYLLYRYRILSFLKKK